ncbi:MAG TPA: histidine kinase N-terminal 7TM domain-containing protein [Anaerolineales bacterium]|nr:histidine kinase N-terminal 7TM domain-containing protein [Anaerolineales bacterium]
MYDFTVTALRTINELLSAGIAITAFSLLLYALSFNLRDRVARSFAIILLCVVIVFVSEALSSVAQNNQQLEFWLRAQWVGIIILPAAYLHFSDALLATTGRPSRGRRSMAVRIGYLASIAFLITLSLSLLVGPLVINGQPTPHLQRTWLSWVFIMLYLLSMVVSWINFWRAYKRTVASTSRRRMSYLITGALAPALGSFPFLLFGFNFAAQHQLIFWTTVTLSNLLISALLVLMAYAVAFFGVPWPDRVVKRRLLKWLMRGPVTASTILAIVTIMRRMGARFGIDLSAIILATIVALILIFEHLITLVVPIWERWLFPGKDREEMQLLQALDERLLTASDMQQFLEAVLAAVCDRLQVSKAFIAALGTQGLELMVTIGGDITLEKGELSETLLEAVSQNGFTRGFFSWGEYWLIPLYDPEETSSELLGLMSVVRQPDQILDDEQSEALDMLSQRVAIALRDRRRQQQAFSSLEALTPQMDMLQRLRAAARYDGAEMLALTSLELNQGDFTSWVKDALTHFWGGPKLTQNPLLRLRLVEQAISEGEDNPTNALRAILRKAIDRVRPDGERRFTAEWILFNILEMKFMEGRKVREIAARLAMSEADLYRKQRVAIEAVAEAIIEMEKNASLEEPSNSRQEASQFIEEKQRGGLNGK